MGPQRASAINGVDDEELDEPEFTPREPLNAVSRLRKQPPGPFRSLGKHLDYRGWPGCERFMELDRAIQNEAQDGRGHEDRASWDQPQAIERSNRRAEAAEERCRSRSRHRPVNDNDEENDEHRPGPSFEEIARGFEELRFRRL